MFQSTRPAWGATKARRRGLAAVYVSIHAPRVGRDVTARGDRGCDDVSIHAPRVGRDGQSGQHRTCQSVSIHAPRVGRDRVRTLRHPERIVSIHAPRVGRDAPVIDATYTQALFQSTRPAWGATIDCASSTNHERVSIHAPRVGRDCAGVCTAAASFCFNPRAPRGARRELQAQSFRLILFQSTRPAWGATIRTRLWTKS